MRNRLGLMSWATGALVLAAVSACSGTSPDPGATTPLPSATVASSSPTTTSPSEAAASQASALVHRYFATLDAVRKDKSVPIARLSSVATSIQLDAARRLTSKERSEGDRQTGDTRVSAVTVQSVNLDNSDPAGGKVPTVTVDACWDVSNVDVVDKTGKSIIRSTRADRGWTRYTVANYHWSSNPSGGWRIVSGQDLKQKPCAGS